MTTMTKPCEDVGEKININCDTSDQKCMTNASIDCVHRYRWKNSWVWIMRMDHENVLGVDENYMTLSIRF